jgi:hypothetical protein
LIYIKVSATRSIEKMTGVILEVAGHRAGEFEGEQP